MRVAGGKKFSIAEWIVLFGLVAITVAMAEFLRIGEKWEHALVYTVIVFAVVILALRPAWGRKVFWQTLGRI